MAEAEPVRTKAMRDGRRTSAAFTDQILTSRRSDATREAVDTDGRALPQDVVSPFEKVLKRDFSRVRLHSGPDAASRSRAIGARAFTIGDEVFVGDAQFNPRDARGRSLLAHELVHVVQQQIASSHPIATTALSSEGSAESEAGRLSRAAEQAVATNGGRTGPVGDLMVRQPAHGIQRQADAGPSDAGPTPPATAPAQGATPGDVADLVIAWMNYHDPMASAGIGDYDKAYAILKSVDADTMLQVLLEIERRQYLDLLASYSGAGRGDPRTEPYLLAVKYRSRDLPDGERARGPGLVGALDPADQAAVRTFLAPLGTHKQEMFVSGPEAETSRLAQLTFDALEAKRKAAESAARAKAESEAKAQGKPPPAPTSAPKVGMGEVVEKEVESRKIKSLPTDAWDKLPDKAKKDWEKTRAPAAIAKIMTSIKGTELESTMKGHPIVFKPREMLVRGGYAYQDGNDLVCGMTFIQDAEKDPKNVWPLLAHEIGGHFEYGTTFASAIAKKLLAKLPEADRKTWTETKEGRTAWFDAYIYHETEIFSALRQRQYDVPVSGAPPTHGGIKPDANVDKRLRQLADAYPKEVATAILIELNRKVQASPTILDRDKKWFLAEVKKRGYSV
jgi:hypothetical protein